MYCLRVALNEKFLLPFIIIISNIYNNVSSFSVIAAYSKCQPLDCTLATTCTIPCFRACVSGSFVSELVKKSDGFKFGDCVGQATTPPLPSIFLHDIHSKFRCLSPEMWKWCIM
jgi:hypothetical protein